MNLSFEWLNEYLDMSVISGNDLSEKMSRTGIEIESIHNYANKLSNLVVGQVIECEPHPESDHLNITQVQIGENSIQQIVCGAPNIGKDMKVIVAKVGASLPNGEIKATKLRGQVSNGMICSLQELGFSDNVVPKKYAQGIFILPEDAPIGADIIDYLKLDDNILELDLTPNRSDALSVIGCAYEVGAILSQKPNFNFNKDINNSSKNLDTKLFLNDIDSNLSQHIIFRLIENVQVKESPIWLQMRLMKMGIRPLNNIVDITNYIMLLFGQPIHAYDYDKLTEKDMGVRLAHPDETIVTIDDVERKLDIEDIVITNGNKPISIAGVMGGKDTEVTSSTTNVLIETAVFNASLIRKTSKKFGLRSEASLRNEKGLNIGTINQASDYTEQMIIQLANGISNYNCLELNTIDESQQSILINYENINKKLGISVNKKELEEIFNRLNFEVDYFEKEFKVYIPTRRWDISIEADILEEVARIYGYDNIPATMPTIAGSPGILTRDQRFTRNTRNTLEGMGLDQVISYILTSEEKAKLIKSEDYSFVQLSLPMSEERTTLRQSMFPAMLEVAQFNFARQAKSIAFYEIGRVFFGQGEGVLPIEQERLSLMISGIKQEKTWHSKEVRYDFFDLKGYIENYFASVRLEECIEYQANSSILVMHPGRTASILFNNEVIGMMGQIHPTIAEKYDLPLDTFFAEMNIEPLYNYDLSLVKQMPITKYPSSSRDVALLVPNTITHAQIVSVIKENGGKYLQTIQLFDEYHGDNIDKDMKSLAYRLLFQNPNETITDDEINNAMNLIFKQLMTIEGISIR